MPYIETLDDIVDELTDKLYIYGAHDSLCTELHPCRACWVPEMHERLVKALENEKRLKKLTNELSSELEMLSPAWSTLKKCSERPSRKTR